jgi:antitoxin VapB
MSILSAETEALIKERAAPLGRSPDEIVREALRLKGGANFPFGHVFPGPDLTPEERRKRVAEIAKRHVARPVLDSRTDEEIIGFDEDGLPN